MMGKNDDQSIIIIVIIIIIIIFRLSRRRRARNLLWSRASVCVCVCLSVCLSACLFAAACPHYCTDTDVTWGVIGDSPSCALLGGITIGARVALLWQNVCEYMLVLGLCLVIIISINIIMCSFLPSKDAMNRLTAVFSV